MDQERVVVILFVLIIPSWASGIIVARLFIVIVVRLTDLLTMVAAVLEHCYDEDTEVSICAHELFCEAARLCSIPSVRRLIGETMTKLHDELVGDVNSEQWPQRRRASTLWGVLCTAAS